MALLARLAVLCLLSCWSIAAALDDDAAVAKDFADLKDSLAHLEELEDTEASLEAKRGTGTAGAAMGHSTGSASARHSDDFWQAMWQKIQVTAFTGGRLDVPGAGGNEGAQGVELKAKVGSSSLDFSIDPDPDKNHAKVKKIRELGSEQYFFNMADRMKATPTSTTGSCISLDEWKTASSADGKKLFTDGLQCGATQANGGAHNYGTADRNTHGTGFDINSAPNRHVKDAFYGLFPDYRTRDPMSTLQIYDPTATIPKDTTVTNIDGLMCGMPGPEGRMSSFWDSCVKPKGGYFNVAYCDTDESYAVLGFAFVSKNMCYPPHMHVAEEAYWQVAGEGRWARWQSYQKVGDMLKENELFEQMGKQARGSYLYAIEEYKGSNTMKRFHPPTVAHEFSTGNKQINTPALDDLMIMVYWWGKTKAAGDNDYRFVRETMMHDRTNKGPGAPAGDVDYPGALGHSCMYPRGAAARDETAKKVNTLMRQDSKVISDSAMSQMPYALPNAQNNWCAVTPVASTQEEATTTMGTGTEGYK